MKTMKIEIDGKSADGIEILLPKAPLVLARAKDGFVMCGYLNVETADKLGVAAAMVRGVSTVDELLSAKVVAATSIAIQKGVQIGMTGRDALSRFS